MTPFPHLQSNFLNYLQFFFFYLTWEINIFVTRPVSVHILCLIRLTCHCDGGCAKVTLFLCHVVTWRGAFVGRRSNHPHGCEGNRGFFILLCGFISSLPSFLAPVLLWAPFPTRFLAHFTSFYGSGCCQAERCILGFPVPSAVQQFFSQELFAFRS